MKTLFIISISILCSLNSLCQNQERKEMRKNGWTTSYDEMTGRTTKKLNLTAGSLKTMSESSIGLIKSGDTYILYSYLYQSQWLFVEKLMVKIDGVLFEFESTDESRKITSQAYISERNWYNPSDEFIEALKNAKEIKYRLYGKDYYKDYEINENKLAPIADFFF